MVFFIYMDMYWDTRQFSKHGAVFHVLGPPASCRCLAFFGSTHGRDSSNVIHSIFCKNLIYSKKCPKFPLGCDIVPQSELVLENYRRRTKVNGATCIFLLLFCFAQVRQSLIFKNLSYNSHCSHPFRARRTRESPHHNILLKMSGLST